MPFIKRHRAGRYKPEVVHQEPDPRAAALAEDLATHASVQAVILGGSRHTGGWDVESDLDLIIILEEEGDQGEVRKAVGDALQELRERHYPGYRGTNHEDGQVEHGQVIVDMEYFLKWRRTVNDRMAQAARQGWIIPRLPGTEGKYQHGGDTSSEWELVTMRKLEVAAREYRDIRDMRQYPTRKRFGRLDVFTVEGRTAYWLLWCSGSAILSILGLGYPNRSLVLMAENLRANDPGWTHTFASDLDCLDQYNSCGCEEVVTRPIEDLEAMWDALETDRQALWQRIRELSGYDLNAALELNK